MAVIDWHAHWVPPEVARLFEARSSEPRIVCEDGSRMFHTGGGVRLPLKESQLDLDRRLDEMDLAGVDRQVLSMAVVYGVFLDRLAPDLAMAAVAANNEGLARLVAQRGDRFSGLAAIPPADPEAAADILDKAMSEQGLLGAILPADGFADKPTAQRFRALFAAANRLKAHLFIHPGGLPGGLERGGARDEAWLVRRRAVGFQDSLTAAAVTLEFTDFLEPYPDVVVHLANLGGTIALLADRIAMTADRMGLPPEMATGRITRCLVDTASFGRRGVALAAEVLGPDRLLFGTDSPALAIAPGLEELRAADLPPRIERDILAGQGLAARRS